jgi:hypothetical protein
MKKKVIEKIEKIEKIERKPIQKDFDKLKKKAELTDYFVKFADKIEIDDKDIPKTERGMETKAKEILEKLNKKIEKVSEKEIKVKKVKG